MSPYRKTCVQSGTQLTGATDGSILENTWLGVLNPKHFLGRLLRVYLSPGQSVAGQ
jgi:hypothetical protein